MYESLISLSPWKFKEIPFIVSFNHQDACVQYWLSQAADPAKVVLGVAAYGRSFTLADPGNNGPGAPAVGPGRAGPYTGTAGSLGYNEICSQSWTVVFDEARRAPYGFRGDQWVGFDNPQ